MPTSVTYHIPYVTDFMIQLRANSMLDIGTGLGKWGFLQRDLVGARMKQTKEGTMTMQVTGVEAHDYPRTVPWLPKIYNTLIESDIALCIDDLDQHELVMCMDCFEHIPKQVGLALLPKLINLATKGFILSLPTEHHFVRNNRLMDYNKYDKHQAHYSNKEIADLLEPHGRLAYQTFKGRYGGVSAFLLTRPT